MRPRALRTFFLVALLALTASCGSLYFVPRESKPDVLARQAGWTQHYVRAGAFDLLAVTHPAAHAGTLTIYIEGDGLAYLGERIVSDDPTPTEPVALELALRQEKGLAAYLARPCQYVARTMDANCEPSYWTERRYSNEVIASMNDAVDRLKHDAGAQHLVLTGYSGGGAVAVLIAARRDDVAAIVTVAANLDLAAWTASNRLAPLDLSLDPAAVAGRVAQIPQVHFAGADDSVVAPAIAASFIRHMAPGHRATLVEMPGFDHSCCWVDSWPALLHRPEMRQVGEAMEAGSQPQ